MFAEIGLRRRPFPGHLVDPTLGFRLLAYILGRAADLTIVSSAVQLFEDRAIFTAFTTPPGSPGELQGRDMWRRGDSTRSPERHNNL
jgi:hypothetical protein